MYRTYIANARRTCDRMWLRSYARESQSLKKTKHISIETEHARRIMHRHREYVMWRDKQTTECSISILQLYGDQSKRFIKQFSRPSDEVRAEIFGLTDEQLIGVLLYYVRISQNPRYDLSTLRKVLVAACAARCHQWTIDRLLLVADIWCSLHSGFRKIFSAVVWAEHVATMSPNQLVQAVFYTTRHNAMKSDTNIFDTRLNELYMELSLDELSIVALRYFRIKSMMSSDIISYIYKELLKPTVLDVIHDTTLVSFLKLLRVAAHNTTQLEMHKRFLQLLISQVNVRPLIVATTHIALFGRFTRCCDDHVFAAIVQRSLTNIKKLRLKDMSVIVYALCMFDYKSSSGIEKQLYSAILQELENHRHAEAAEFPNVFNSCVGHLSCVGVHSNRLINQIFEPSNLYAVYGTAKNVCHEILVLDSYAKVNLERSYRGHLLTVNDCAQWMSEYTILNPMAVDYESLQPADRMTREIWDCLTKFYGKCVWAHALPYIHWPHIHLAINTSTMRSVDIYRRYSSYCSGQILRKDLLTDANTQIEIFVIILAGEGSYVCTGHEQRLKGGVLFNVNQLKLLGFRPIVIPFFEWKKISKTYNQRITYLNGRIQTSTFAAKMFSR